MMQLVQQRISRIHKVEFTAISDSRSGWSGAGNGDVTIESKSNNIFFKERGTWTNKYGQKLKFSNIYKWTFETNSLFISLAHLRFGNENPVHLFKLKPELKSLWLSAHPYICNKDLYSVIMKIEANQIILKWKVNGPSKKEEITYKYT